jgi:hypothetical protein
MIDRDNWKLIKAYKEYWENVEQISSGSLRVEATFLRYILEWADSVPFRKDQSIRPTLPEYFALYASGWLRRAIIPELHKKGFING